MRKYVISKEKALFIKENFIEWSLWKGDDYQISIDVFQKLSHPAELHVLAYFYNWDDGSSVLEWILESPLCSRSTANHLFWRAAPDYYLEFDMQDENSCPSFSRDGFRVIRKVLERYSKNNFCNEKIEYDPTNEIEEISNKNPKWEIPKEVYDKIEGIQIFIEE